MPSRASVCSVRASSGCFSRWPTAMGSPLLPRKMRAPSGTLANCAFLKRRPAWRRGYMSKPSRASLIAGSRLAASGSLPYFCCSSARPAGSPGMPAASAVLVDAPRTGLPCASRNMSRVAAAGATSRASMTMFLPSLARCSRYMPPPAMPEPEGSTTASAALTATAASNALPPLRRTSSPAAVASGCALAIAAWFAAAAPVAVAAAARRAAQALETNASIGRTAQRDERARRVNDGSRTIRPSSSCAARWRRSDRRTRRHCRRRSRSRGSASRR